MKCYPFFLSLLFPLIMCAVSVELENSNFSDELSAWQGRLDGCEVSSITVEGESFDTALRVSVNNQPEKPWFAQVRQALDEKIYAGELIEVSAMMRSSERVTVAMALQLGSRPFTPLVFNRFQLTPDWEKVVIRGKLKQTLAAGGGAIVMTFGFGVGVIELSDVQVKLLERDTLSDVPDSFAALSWAEEDLPLIDLDSHPILMDHELPDGPYRSVVEGIDGFKLQGAKIGSMSRVPVVGQHFSEAIRMKTDGYSDHVYGLQIKENLIKSVQKGDTLLALFSYRVYKPNPDVGYGASQFALEKNSGRYDKIFMWGVAADDEEWHHCVLPFSIDSDLAAGSAQLVFRGGYGPQTIDIGGVSIVNLGQGVSHSSLPKSRMDYLGSAPDASWRKEAQVRIEKYRKGDFVLKFVDSDGNPLVGEQVQGRLIRHKYSFGSALGSPALLSGNWRYDAEFGKVASEMFNAGSLENAMKMKQAYLPGIDDKIEAGLSWMEAQNFHIRGHTMVWPSWRYSPKEIVKLKDEPEALRTAVLERIHSLGTRYAGRIDDWDVINEPYTNYEYMDLLGLDEMDRWMLAARDAAPDAKLFVNDFGLVTRPGSGNPKMDYYLKLIKRFKENNVPIDGIGLQSHFMGSLTPISHVLEILDTFSSAGVDVQITELTLNVEDEQTQADYARDFITAVFSHPSTDLVQTWGFWEGYMFEPIAAMFRKDWSPKPIANSFRELVNETWSTHVDTVTDSNGEIHFRGFYGNYEFELPNAQPSTSFEADFNADGDSQEQSI